jgi:hypothetical protein
MGGASNVLTSVKEGDLWRVQIAWPSGTTKHFGKFGSEQEAAGWISRHRALTERANEDTKYNRPLGFSQRAKGYGPYRGRAGGELRACVRKKQRKI